MLIFLTFKTTLIYNCLIHNILIDFACYIIGYQLDTYNNLTINQIALFFLYMESREKQNN